MMRTEERAGDLADLLFEHSQINPRGFRAVPTGKHSNGRDRAPTMLESLAVEAGIMSGVPKRERGKRQDSAERITKGGQRGIMIGDRKTGRARIFRP